MHLVDLVARGDRWMVYEDHFGDGWTHTIEIDDALDEEGPKLACLDGARACPPEDRGGVDGHHHLLEILFDPTDEEFEDSRQWGGRPSSPSALIVVGEPGIGSASRGPVSLTGCSTLERWRKIWLLREGVSKTLEDVPPVQPH